MAYLSVIITYMDGRSFLGKGLNGNQSFRPNVNSPDQLAPVGASPHYSLPTLPCRIFCRGQLLLIQLSPMVLIDRRQGGICTCKLIFEGG